MRPYLESVFGENYASTMMSTPAPSANSVYHSYSEDYRIPTYMQGASVSVETNTSDVRPSFFPRGMWLWCGILAVALIGFVTVMWTW